MREQQQTKEPSDFATFLWQSQELVAQYIANIHVRYSECEIKS